MCLASHNENVSMLNRAWLTTENLRECMPGACIEPAYISMSKVDGIYYATSNTLDRLLLEETFTRSAP